MSDWERHVDESSGQEYWWNPETDESVWEDPGSGSGSGPGSGSGSGSGAGAAMKSFLDPETAAGFPRTMRSAETRTPEQTAAVRKTQSSAPRDMSAFEDADDDLYGDDAAAKQQPEPEPEPEPPGTGPTGGSRAAQESPGEVDRSLSYKELVEMTQAGKLPPGIKRIDDKPRGRPPAGFSRSATKLTTLKPWERQGAAQASAAPAEDSDEDSGDEDSGEEDDSDEDEESGEDEDEESGEDEDEDSDEDEESGEEDDSEEEGGDAEAAAAPTDTAEPTPKKSAADAADPVETPRTAAQLKSLEDTPGSIWDEESEDDETTEESEEEAQQEDQEEDGENEDEREEEQDDYEVCSACLLASHFRSH